MSRSCALAVAALLLAPSAASAGPLVARETADVGNAGEYSIGLLAPLTVALKDKLELQTYPLVFFVSPNFVFRVGYGEWGGFRFAGEFGLSCPTPAMKLAQGYLFPTWEKNGGQVGWFLVPRLGIVATRGNRASRTLTLSADLAAGVPLSRNDATGMTGVIPVAELFAPVFTGFRGRMKVSYDARLGLDWLRGRLFLGMNLHGTNVDYPSPVTVNGGGGFDVAVGKSSRFTLGFIWWNADTRAIDPKTHKGVRSNDVYPTIDFIWAG